jgi:hypothetical protein
VTVFRCTARLAKRLRVELASDALPSAGSLGDWYANSLNIGTARYVLCLSSLTLLPVILPSRKAEFPSRFPHYLGAVLQAIGVAPALIESELQAPGPFTYAKTRDRSLIGSLNDFIHCGSAFLEYGESPLDANLKLTDMPTKVLGYGRPADAARAAIESRASG